MNFFRLLARIRYWRSRALRAETRVIEVSAQAEAEKWRNVEREDTFVSAAVLGGRGMIGMSPRSGPAAPRELPRLLAEADPVSAITALERMEYQTQWLPAGREKGLSEKRIMQDFIAELATRKSFNDEPLIS